MATDWSHLSDNLSNHSGPFSVFIHHSPFTIIWFNDFITAFEKKKTKRKAFIDRVIATWHIKECHESASPFFGNFSSMVIFQKRKSHHIRSWFGWAFSDSSGKLKPQEKRMFGENLQAAQFCWFLAVSCSCRNLQARLDSRLNSFHDCANDYEHKKKRLLVWILVDF